MIKILVGVIIGIIAATTFFLAENFGYFEGIYSITRADIVRAQACTRLTPEEKWYIEPAGNGSALVTLSYPFHRHQFLLDLKDVSNPESLKGKHLLRVTNTGSLVVESSSQGN